MSDPPDEVGTAETLPPASPTGQADPILTVTAIMGETSPGTVANSAPPGYEILDELGRGGMGVVYRARQTKLNRIVALKMILAGGYAGPAELARFKTEAEAIARLQHPGIVTIHEIGEHEAKPFFSLEFCAGGSLDRKLSGTPIDPTEAAKLLRALADAMQAAHDANVIHRDLKPANILLSVVSGPSSVAEDADQRTTDNGQRTNPKITDFGLAKKLDEAGQTVTGAVMGTPSYMAPEQAEGKKQIGPAADIYSLGAILYECLSGRPPFKSVTSFDTLLQVVSDEPVPLRRLNAKVPVDLETICHKCLAKEPGKRYAAARALAEDLDRFLAGQPVLARPIGRLERGMRWSRRNPVVAALSCLIGLLLLAAAVAGPMVAVQQASLRREADEQRTLAICRAEDLDVERHRAETNADEAALQAKTARNALYAARQQVAMNAWRENRTDRMAEVLQRQIPAPGEQDLRGFEWSYLDRLSRSPGTRWQTSGRMVNGVAISPDNRTAIKVGFDAKATAWDVAGGRRKWDTGAAFRFSINAVAIAPDGKTVALGGHVGQLQLWGIDGKAIAKLPGHGSQVFGVAFSSDGRTLASAGADCTVRLWDVATGKQVGMLGENPFARPGPRGPQAFQQTNPEQSIGHTNMVWQAAWSPDGKRLASCSTDGSIKVWAVAGRKLLRTLMGHEGIVVAVAWSPDGQQIASVSRSLAGVGGGEIRLWNPDTGRVDTTFRPPSGGLFAVAFTPDGLYLVTAGQDRTVRVWRKDGRAVAEHRGFHDDVIGLAVGGGGRWAIAGSRAGEIAAFDLDAVPGMRSIPAFDGTRLAVARDGRLVAFRHGAVHWHDPETLVEKTVWPAVAVPQPKPGEMVFSSASAFALRPDGQCAHGGHGFIGPGTVVWRDAIGKVRHLLSGHAAPITAVAFLPGERLASADEAGAVKIWNGADGKAVASLRPWTGPVRFLKSTANGRLWVGGVPWAPGADQRRLRPATLKEGRLAQIDKNRVAWQGTMTSAPSAGDLAGNDRLMAVGFNNGELVWLDTNTNKESRRQSTGSGAVTCLRFSPDASRIAVGKDDGTVRLLDAGSGEELLVLKGSTLPPDDLVFFDGGRRLAVVAARMLTGGTLTVWDGRPTGGPPALPAPDAAWHKARLAAATARSGLSMWLTTLPSPGAAGGKPQVMPAGGKGDANRRSGGADRFAVQYHMEKLKALGEGK